jgi:hypothetical protein
MPQQTNVPVQSHQYALKQPGMKCCPQIALMQATQAIKSKRKHEQSLLAIFTTKHPASQEHNNNSADNTM